MYARTGYGRGTMNEKLLRIYLQDHLAGSTAGLELARRTRGANQGTEYGPPLAKIADEIEADRRQLEGIIDELGFGGDRFKNVAAWGLEKMGRLKLNGQLKGYSPLSRVVELEGLLTGITGKKGLWNALLEIAPGEPRLDAALLERLRDRAEEQRATVEELRQRAAREAFAA
jgi:predicted DNA-binding ribbon-helix-helix protein